MKPILAIALSLSTPSATPAFNDDLRSSDLRTLGICLVEARPDQVRGWVDANGPQLMFSEIDDAVEQTACGPAEKPSFKLEYWTARGAMAEALFRRSVDPGALPDLRNAPRPTDLQTALHWKNPVGRTGNLLNVLTECVAAADIEKVAKLFETEPDSGSERVAFDDLKSRLHVCRRYAGNVELKQSTAMIRARLAIAAFRLNEAVAATRTHKTPSERAIS